MDKDTPYREFGIFFTGFLNMYFAGMTQTEIANELKTQQGYISKITRGDRLPSPEIIERIYGLLGKDIKPEVEKAKKDREKYIRDGMARNGKSSYYDKGSETLYINNEITKPRLPVRVSEGLIAEYYSGIYESECERTPIIKQFSNYDFTMIVQGDSMEPKFEGGDEIACKKVEKTIIPGQTYLVDTVDGAFLKRVYPEGKRIRCASYNKDYQDFYVDKLDVNGLYRVVGLMRFNL